MCLALRNGRSNSERLALSCSSTTSSRWTRRWSGLNETANNEKAIEPFRWTRQLASRKAEVDANESQAAGATNPATTSSGAHVHEGVVGNTTATQKVSDHEGMRTQTWRGRRTLVGRCTPLHTYAELGYM